jgi:hypothetical protein
MNNFKDQKDRIIESGYKYISLWRGDKQIATWNTANKIDAKLDEIETRLKNNEPGLYTILARNATKGASDSFHINTGGEKLSEAQPQIIYKEPENSKLLENQQILNLTVQVKQLEMENKYLKDQVSDLENEIAELESAAATTLAEQTPAPSLIDSAKEFLGGLMEFGAPLLDQHFALKKQQLEIERMKLANRRPAPGTPQAVKDQNVQIRVIGEWVETFKDQPEIYEALHTISAQSDSVEKYLELLNQFSPELYEQLSIKI